MSPIFGRSGPSRSGNTGWSRGAYANVPHEELGWAPRPGTAVSQREFYRGELVYGATYTIGPNGLRISSPSGDHDAPRAACILFFGDSFTFGQGLDDHQTLPFQVSIKLNHQYRTFNFGVMGYGAHQMLSALQHGLVDDAMSCDRARVSDVLYQAIPDHVRRSAGRFRWNTRGPRYRLTDDGSVRLDGRFEDDHGSRNTLIQSIGNQLARSMIYKAVLEGRYVYKYGREAIDLYVGIVGEARDFVHSHYSCARFHVLSWDEDEIDNRAVSDGLRQMGIDIHLMSEILPHYRVDDLNEAYRLHRADPHPNAAANDLIADYVVREILPRPGPCDSPQSS